MVSEGNSFTPGDPTQRLVTALGKFHRYVVKGQAGAAQEYWSDDCMNQLAAGIEIALSQDWIHIVEALTDVARILQSYENERCAQMCVPFLNESYEILSAMVGDLIVNKTGSAIMERWRERYKRAVAELEAAGLTLVQDEESEHIRLEPIGDGASPEEDEEAALDLPPAGDAAPARRGKARSSDPMLDSFLPFLDAPETEEAVADEVAADAEEVPAYDEAELPAALAPANADDVPGDSEVVELLDSLCEDLAVLEKGWEAEHETRLAELEGKVARLERHAATNALEVPRALCRRMAALCRQAPSRGHTAEYDRFLDLAYAFCGAYVEAGTDPDCPAATSWQADADALLDQWTEPGAAATTPSAPPVPRTAVAPSAPAAPRAPAAATVIPEPPAPPSGDATPESLLETARQAMAAGDLSWAKSLALQAVARMANAETAKADARVREAELRLKESGEAIDRARANVRRAEQEVAAAEARVAEDEAELNETRASFAKGSEQTAEIEHRIARIDEQIRALQAQHAAEEARAAEASEELERIRERGARCEAELREQQEAEDRARLHLEAMRQQVKDLQRKRTECEETLTQSREALVRNQASLSDIERTVAQLSPSSEEEPTQPGDLLF